jgi:hypothetical protein
MMPFAVPAMALALAAAGCLRIAIGINRNGSEHWQQKQGAQKSADDPSHPRPLPAEVGKRH